MKAVIKEALECSNSRREWKKIITMLLTPVLSCMFILMVSKVIIINGPVDYLGILLQKSENSRSKILALEHEQVAER